MDVTGLWCSYLYRSIREKRFQENWKLARKKNTNGTHARRNLALIRALTHVIASLSKN